jgi:hypothetical protein
LTFGFRDPAVASTQQKHGSSTVNDIGVIDTAESWPSAVTDNGINRSDTEPLNLSYTEHIRYQIPCISDTRYHAYQIPDTMHIRYQIPCISDTRYHAYQMPDTMHIRYQIPCISDTRYYAYQIPDTMHIRYQIPCISDNRYQKYQTPNISNTELIG